MVYRLSPSLAGSCLTSSNGILTMHKRLEPDSDRNFFLAVSAGFGGGATWDRKIIHLGLCTNFPRGSFRPLLLVTEIIIKRDDLGGIRELVQSDCERWRGLSTDRCGYQQGNGKGAGNLRRSKMNVQTTARLLPGQKFECSRDSNINLTHTVKKILQRMTIWKVRHREQRWLQGVQSH